jgi:FG-GAP-like repeat
MRTSRIAIPLLLLPALLLSALAADPPKEPPPSPLKWKKIVVDKRFQSEGAAIGDINKDGKMDVVNGELWYEAPDWKPHRFRKGKDDYTQGDKNVYSQSMCAWTDDVNGDGWTDIVVVGFPGEPCFWYENPGTKDRGLWAEHQVWHSACNETPQYIDLFGTGKRVLVMGWQPKGKGDQGQMAWFDPDPSDPTKLWRMHPISEPSIAKEVKDGKPVPGTGKEIPGTQRFSHGLGVGDINGDGKLDVIITGGWWEQPAKVGDEPWKFHPANLGPACADMYAYDLDGDAKADVISSSAHQFGIWSYRQRTGKEHPSFLKVDLFPQLVSETHAMICVDMDGDGLRDLVTGKRFWSHGYNEPGSRGPAMVYWFQARKSADGTITFTPHVIDNDSGIGTQFTVADINGDGKLDVITSNKKGTYIHLQQ